MMYKVVKKNIFSKMMVYRQPEELPAAAFKYEKILFRRTYRIVELRKVINEESTY